jgi:AsmA family protein
VKKILTVFVLLCAVAAAVIGIAVATFDINKHRGEIEAALGKAIGRDVKLGGDIHIGLSGEGLTLSIKDAAFGNPPWASRPHLASIGLFNLKIGLLSLLAHRVDISGFAIENADILLETSKDHHNWDMQIADAKPESAEPAAKNAESPVAINLANLSIKNSRIAVRGEDGKITVFKADTVTLGSEGAGIGLHFAGSLNGLPVKLAVLTSSQSLMEKTVRPVTIDLVFANYRLVAGGKIDLSGQKADFTQYDLASGASKISGHLFASWGGARPSLQGTITSDRLVPDDFKLGGAEDAAEASPHPAAAKAPQRVFSDAPLALDSLRAADADLNLSLASMPAGSVELQNVKGKLSVSNGRLQLSPLTMGLGAGSITVRASLDAGVSPAHFSGTVTVSDVDLSDLIQLWGVEAFLSGRVKGDINLAGSGNSPHELASGLNGTINIIGAGGDVVSSAAGQISAGLAEILAPGTGNKNENMNCLVARFIAHEGVIRGNGILIDTMAATAAGYGDIDLRSETLNLAFHAKPKLIDIVGGLIPPLHIGGTLSKPSVSADANAVMQNVGQLLTSGSFNDTVPDLLTQQGQNACAYTLDHRATAAPQQPENLGGVVQGLAGKAQSLIKGLLGQ